MSVRAPSGSKRILLLSIVNPLCEQNGASTVTRGLIKLLARPPLQAAVECIPVRDQPVRWLRAAQGFSVLRSLVSALPAKAAFLYSKTFRDRVVARLRSQRFEVVILNGADLLWIADYLPASIPRILIAHNIEHQLFRTQLEHSGWSGWPCGELLGRDCRRLEEYELQGMREAGNVVFLSREDAIYARDRCPDLRSITVPPVFDYEPDSEPRKEPSPALEVGFVGNFLWWPNQLSVRWFSEKVLPWVDAPIRLHLFGHPAGRNGNPDPRIVRHGVVERIEQAWKRCDFLIAPDYPTGGVSVKLAEAVYNRMPVLARRNAARGLPLGDDPALIFLNEPQQWIDFLNSPVARELARRRVGEELSARFAIETHRQTLQQFVAAAMSSERMPGARRDLIFREAAEPV